MRITPRPDVSVVSVQRYIFPFFVIDTLINGHSVAVETIKFLHYSIGRKFTLSHTKPTIRSPEFSPAQ
jgi:hypothetical protein